MCIFNKTWRQWFHYIDFIQECGALESVKAASEVRLPAPLLPHIHQDDADSHRTWFCVLLVAPLHHIVLILNIKSKPLLHSESKTKIDQLPSIRCTVQCQGLWQRRTLLSRMDRRLSTRALKTKDGFSSETWFHTGPWWRAWTLWDKNYGFVYRLDLSAAGEVSELMDNAAYEVYLKECEEHWLTNCQIVTIHIHQIQITDYPRLC